jgi:DNA-binding beta-propeller fold protein YncE
MRHKLQLGTLVAEKLHPSLGLLFVILPLVGCTKTGPLQLGPSTNQLTASSLTLTPTTAPQIGPAQGITLLANDSSTPGTFNFTFSLSPNVGQLVLNSQTPAVAQYFSPITLATNQTVTITVKNNINGNTASAFITVVPGLSPTTTTTTTTTTILPASTTTTTMASNSTTTTTMASNSTTTTTMASNSTTTTTMASQSTTTTTTTPKAALPALKISPTSGTIPVNGQFQLTASAGIPPYSWSVSSKAAGTVDENGLFTSQPNYSGPVDVTVTDKASPQQATAVAHLIVGNYSFPTLSPLSVDLPATATTSFTIANGQPPYQVTLTPTTNAGTATVKNSKNGYSISYTAPAQISSSSLATILLTDNVGSTAKVKVNLYAAPNFTPRVSLVGGSLAPLASTTGKPPFTATSAVVTPVGSFDSNRMVFAADIFATGETSLTFSDSLNQIQTIFLDVLPKMIPNPANTKDKIQLNNPTGFSIDKDQNLFIADNFNHRIVKYSAAALKSQAFGTKGSLPGQLLNPWGVAISKSTGKIYVSEYGNHRISVFDSNFNFITSFGTQGTDKGLFNFPKGIFLDSNEKLYVADTGNHRIQVFDTTQNNALFTVLGSEGTDVGQLYLPTSVFVQSNVIYVCDNSRVTSFDLAHQNKASIIGLPGTTYQQPSSLTVTSNGHYLILDRVTSKIMELDSQQNSLSSFGGPSTVRGQFNQPELLVTDPQGIFPITVVDSKNNRIQFFSTVSPRTSLSTGETLQLGQSLVPPTTLACGLYMQYDGNLVMYKDGSPTHCTKTQGSDLQFLLKLNSNMVVYEDNQNPSYNFKTLNDGGTKLVMQDDCSLVLLKPDGKTVVWNSDKDWVSCK